MRVLLRTTLLSAALLAVWLLPAGLARAADETTAATATPRDIVSDTVDKVTKILGDPAYKNSERRPPLREQIRQTILKVVDMDQVGRLTLGQYRKKFDDKQFRRFCDLFSRLVFTTYISHMEKYNGQKIIVLNTENLAEDRVLVHTKTLDATREIPVDYTFFRSPAGWRMYDVHIEGVSLVNNYKSQFTEILTNKKPDQLNDQIETKVKENETNLQSSDGAAAGTPAAKPAEGQEK